MEGREEREISISGYRGNMSHEARGAGRMGARSEGGTRGNYILQRISAPNNEDDKHVP